MHTWKVSGNAQTRMGFYNRVRRHSALDYLSPHDFEMQFLRQTCTLLNEGIAELLAGVVTLLDELK